MQTHWHMRRHGGKYGIKFREMRETANAPATRKRAGITACVTSATKCEKCGVLSCARVTLISSSRWQIYPWKIYLSLHRKASAPSTPSRRVPRERSPRFWLVLLANSHGSTWIMDHIARSRNFHKRFWRDLSIQTARYADTREDAAHVLVLWQA